MGNIEDWRVNPAELVSQEVQRYSNGLKVKEVGKQFGELLQDLVEIDHQVKLLRQDKTEEAIKEAEIKIGIFSRKLGEFAGNLDITSQDIANELKKLGLG